MLKVNGAKWILAGLCIMLAGMALWMYGDLYVTSTTWVYYSGSGMLLFTLGVVIWALTDYTSIKKR